MNPAGSISDDPGKAARVYRRSRKGRDLRITVRFSADEYAEVMAGATGAGWTVAGWTAAASIAAARQVRKPVDS